MKPATSKGSEFGVSPRGNHRILVITTSPASEVVTTKIRWLPRRLPPLLAGLLLLSLSVSLFGQAVYIENQIPAGGVQIEYAVTIKNPVSHLYDVEMDVKGLRTTSVSFSMP